MEDAQCVRTNGPREVCRVFAALSDLNRFRIVQLLSAGGKELPSGTIAAALGLSPSLISHHLAILEANGLVERRRDGLWSYARLRRDEIARHLAMMQELVGVDGG